MTSDDVTPQGGGTEDQDTATEAPAAEGDGPAPVPTSELTSEHSAHSVTPYAAFSTLHPTTTRPSSTSAAAPTGNPE